MLKAIFECLVNTFVPQSVDGITVRGCCRSKRILRLAERSMYRQPAMWCATDGGVRNPATNLMVIRPRANIICLEVGDGNSFFTPSLAWQLRLRLAMRHVKVTHIHQEVFGW